MTTERDQEETPKPQRSGGQLWTGDRGHHQDICERRWRAPKNRGGGRVDVLHVQSSVFTRHIAIA
jgi:hypothetical protein